MILGNIFLLKELLTCGTRYHPWLSMHRCFIVLRHDYISFGLTKILCMTLKHHSWELVVEVILSVIVSFTVLCT